MLFQPNLSHCNPRFPFNAFFYPLLIPSLGTRGALDNWPLVDWKQVWEAALPPLTLRWGDTPASLQAVGPGYGNPGLWFPLSLVLLGKGAQMDGSWDPPPPLLPLPAPPGLFLADE